MYFFKYDKNLQREFPSNSFLIIATAREKVSCSGMVEIHNLK